MKGQFFPYKDENPRQSFPYITIGIIIICIIVFIWSLTNFEYIITTYGFTPIAPTILTIFTSMFLHGGIDHIFGNMWFLWIFGDNVEDKLGKIRFTIFYLLSGVAATFVHWLSNSSSAVPAIGASGAISGVLGAYLVMFPHVKIHVAGKGIATTLPAYVMIGFWFVLQIIFGSLSIAGGSGSGIAFWAHIGGFIFGAAIAFSALRLGLLKTEQTGPKKL